MRFLKISEQKKYFGYQWQMATASTVSIQKCLWEQGRSPCFQCWKPSVCLLQCVQSASVTERERSKQFREILSFTHVVYKKQDKVTLSFFVGFFFGVFVCVCLCVGVVFLSVFHWMHLEMLTFYFDMHHQNNKLWNSQYWHVHICLFHRAQVNHC